MRGGKNETPTRFISCEIAAAGDEMSHKGEVKWGIKMQNEVNIKF